MSDQQHSVSQLKTQLKQLKIEKGRLSRTIGGLKKDNQPIDSVLEEMKVLSEKKNFLDCELKKLIKTELAPQQSPSSIAFPSHIRENASSSNEKTHDKLYSIRKISNDDSDSWNEFVNKHPASSIYHQFDFKGIIEKSFNQEACYFAAFDKDESIVGILPIIHTKSHLFGSYMTSIPYFNYGGPLTVNRFVERQLVEHVDHYARQTGVSYVELRESSVRKGMPSKTDKVSLFLTLPESSEQLWVGVGTKVRAQIKKGLKNNFQFKVGRHELLDDFYRVFSINMRDLGTPVYSKLFFKNILSSQLDTMIAVQYHQGSATSCAFLMAYKNCLEIPWASTLGSANKLNSNMVLYWNILKYACDKSYDFFDFGRSTIDAPTFKFKCQWGASPAQLHWHYMLPGDQQVLPSLNPNNPKLKLLIWCWKKLPIVIANTIGPILARSLP